MHPALRLLLAPVLLPLGCVLATPDDLALRGAGDTGRDVAADAPARDAPDAPARLDVADAAELVDLPAETAAPDATDAVALHDAPDATDAAVGGDAVDAGEAPGDAWGGDDAPDAGDAAPPADAGEAPDAPMGQDASDVPAPRDAGMADVRDAPSEVDAGDAAGADATGRDDGGVADTGPTCAVGEVFCGGRCADLRRDPANCGACGRGCRSDDACEAGRCVGWVLTGTADPDLSPYMQRMDYDAVRREFDGECSMRWTGSRLCYRAEARESLTATCAAPATGRRTWITRDEADYQWRGEASAPVWTCIEGAMLATWATIASPSPRLLACCGRGPR